MSRKAYATDLTDQQWTIIEPLIPVAKPGERPRGVDLREVMNSILYQNRTGCQWDMLPHDLLPKSTVYEYFGQWRDDGTLIGMLASVRSAQAMLPHRHQLRQNRTQLPRLPPLSPNHDPARVSVNAD